MSEKNNHVPGSDPNGSEPEAQNFDDQNVDSKIHEQVTEFLKNVRSNSDNTEAGGEEKAETGGPTLSESISDAVEAEVAAEHESDSKALEYLADLQRLQAEFQNYRKRVDRDQELNKQRILVETLRDLVPVLDDLDRVDAAGDLENSPLEAIAKKFRTTLERMGLESFGQVGDAFDPNIHEAIHKLVDPEVETETVADVVQIGYRVGDLELRPAQVAVRVPQD